jgi:hypothetical protein
VRSWLQWAHVDLWLPAQLTKGSWRKYLVYLEGILQITWKASRKDERSYADSLNPGGKSCLFLCNIPSTPKK